MSEILSLADAAARGRAAALEFDARLRDVEAAERDARFAAVGYGPEAAVQAPLADAFDLARVRSELEALQRYRSALDRSRVWRLAQFLRRLVGRAW